MAQDFGNGVSRTLSAKSRQFLQTVWQASKPPLDSELNLVAQISNEQLREAVQSEMHSGFVMNPCAAESSFVTNPNWSNWFQFGRPSTESNEAPFLWANVNGWIVPVSGSSVAEGDPSNRINLFPPPATDARIDFVFLEVWQAQVAPNPSTVNKPAASTLYKYGNVKYGGTNVTDDIQDPTIGFETTERVQLQYRIRVVGSGTGLGDSIDLAQYPDGLDDPNVIAQGSQVSPVAGYTFSNMGVELGDKGLWRSGNGDETSRSDLGSVDGYTYAIPICAVFRRNYNLFKAIDTGNANQNGSFDRNPTSGAITDPVQSARTFTPVTLVGDLDEDFTGLVSVSGLAGSGLDNVNILWSSTVLVIGDEILTVSAVDAAAGTITVDSRGRFGTQATLHEAGSSFGFYTFRPDGKFSDQIDSSDILDLRRSVIFGEWSYESVLKHNLGKLLSGNLRSSYKQGSGTDTQGTRIIEVDSLLGRGAGSLPPQTEQLDGFDGIRTVFSDSACVQNHVSLALVPDSGSVNASTDWEVAADFAVSGFIPSGNSTWENGTVIRLFIGGSSGQDGARKTSASSDAFMRFVGPREYWLSRDQMPVATPESSSLGNQTPFLMRFIGDSSTGPQTWSQPAGLGETPNSHPGPMFPLPDQGFIAPYAVLGGVVNSELTESAVAVTHVAGPLIEVEFTGQDFDAVGAWVADPSSPRTSSLDGISKTLLHGKKNLYDMLTNGGRDITGRTSELYLFLTGGTTDSGLFRVIGAGITNYTSNAATAADRLRVEPVGVGSSISLGETVNAEVRSLYTNTEDNIGSSSAAVVVVITDIQGVRGGATNPWNGITGGPTISGEMVLDTSILYGPSRGAMARVPDDLLRFAVFNPVGTNVLRESPENKDPSPADIRGRTGAPEDEYYYDSQPLMAWNRLQSLGLSAPAAPHYGENRYNFETSRESELFLDGGSKTVVFRPFRQVSMSLPLRRTAGAQIPSNYLDGITPIDGAGLFTDTDVYDVPLEYMPRFGRQDIPVRENAGTDGPYFGINHLFSDTPTPGDATKGIVGGTSAGLPLKIVTGASTGFDYGYWDSPNNRYQGRIYTDVNARSTDINKPMRGIQLPPYLGVARVYGVYEKSDYDVNGSAWLNGLGYTPDTGVAKGTNLLRTNADKQTLFIVKDGAADVMAAGSDAHTYVIPEEAVDISLHPAYTSGQKFEDLEYVVEVAVFGFAQGFINKNNYVLDRGVYTSDQLVNDIRMIIPTAMPGGVLGYSAYQRTVYQGDPFMTRSAVTLQTADYRSRHGQIPVLDAFALKAPLQQYDNDNDQVPEIPNARGLRILSTVDFWTTLGTGKIGGKVFPGTVTDSGYLESTGGRIPSSSTDNQYQPHVRSLSAGQPEDGHYAELAITILDNPSISGTTLVFERGGGTGIAITEGVDWTAGASAVESVENLSQALNNLGTSVGLSLRNTYKVRSHPYGTTLVIQAVVPGSAGEDTFVTISDTDVYRLQSGLSSYSALLTRLPLSGGHNVPVNASRSSSAPTPVRAAGMTDRLPLGILVQDSDFLGEDPLRQGVAYSIKSGGGAQSTTEVSTFFGDSQIPSERLHGAGGEMGMADGAILQYTAYNAVSAPDGTRRFRLYRGGGSVYVLSSEAAGGPVDYSAGGLSEGDEPVVKGAILTGRAYLVHNSYEEAFAGTAIRSYGDEVQMVVVTSAVYGEGAGCEHGYALDGIISPTDYGKGYSAADRYRLEGKPMVKSTNAIRDPNIPLIPYPPEDPADDDPCA